MAGAGQARPLITFHAPGGRTFQRIFRDATLSETKDAVRQKLKWPAHEEISLARIEDGRHIDLDDDDDFDAFRIATRSKPTVEVSVTVGSSSIPAGPSINHAQPPADLPSSLPPSEPTSVLAVSRKRKRLRPSMAPGDERALSIDRGSGTPVNATGASTPTTHAGVSSVQVLPGASRPGAQDADVERPRKKRKKLKFREPSVQDSVERSASNPPPSYVPRTRTLVSIGYGS
ncbi:uncharacterized protein C8Q71DRAFT_323919 [Rhodofomes roseus]|uniref:Ubiquitin-like domain-containing protein n=1 Tax=Rhodofomes roseus TaxID=34475 RepID=A0ABQ8K2A5_9APHY|nr:uncharacterized protein C8Q71DRAFT_323919 [Rhodofomes roseus]KAH9830831.1 hypothetical protein C8Q71DRAFT_323919 [Rhodofomes roseus]